MSEFDAKGLQCFRRDYLLTDLPTGALNNDLADCEHLRELILHGNCITGGKTEKAETFILSSPGSLAKLFVEL